MWIRQGKYTISGNYGFVQQIHNIVVQFLADLKVQSRHHDNNYPVRFGSLQNFLGKNMLECELQTEYRG